MGLDQYAEARKGEPTTDEYGYVSYADSIELACWRKHPNLQGWMENLHYRKGGEGEFNCVDLVLTLQDLDELEEAIDEDCLPETQGFFFGGDSDDYYRKQDREFIEHARDAIKNGYTVVYSSWW